MRTSVERRREHTANHRRRVSIALVLLLIASMCVLFLSYARWRAYTDAQSQAAVLVRLDGEIAAAKRARITNAKDRESTAKANAEAYTAAQSQDTTATEANASKSCGVVSPDSIIVIVNKKRCFDPVDWEPSDLTFIDDYMLREEAATYMTAMMDAASSAGYPFLISSGYRSYSQQEATYENWVMVNGSRSAADTVSARPGYSDHQTGLAADLKIDGCVLECFGTTDQYQWLVSHAADYGFIQRYPDGLTSITGYDTETWHWRYIGTALAKVLKQEGIETLEAYFNVTGGDYR